ncbi:hypothetical protein ZIOFF_029109 [Zingiber officinale]|uniref:non-specific serine/threonine protein kinase n=1 Tax=Zingiber officinale TaxID=94328 RepID=A0A8J5L3Z1_ZINOF|nr:hypothetical protein ZIOFF_029109 [Zingiber officinale]
MEAGAGGGGGGEESYEVVEQIGRGSFGAAFLVVHKAERKRYVISALHGDACRRHHLSSRRAALQVRDEEDTPDEADGEIPSHRLPGDGSDRELEQSLHRGVQGWMGGEGYCEGGDMAAKIKRARGGFFSEDVSTVLSLIVPNKIMLVDCILLQRVCKWLTQLLLAVDYLHSNRVLHRDLKDDNVRLGDFGLAKLLNSEDLTSSVVGTPNYMCPEILADIPYGYKSDIWSLGCCMFEIAAHRPAYKAADMQGLINKINKSSIAPMPPIYSSSLKRLIKCMLRKSPEHRPIASELLRDPYLQKYLAASFNPSPLYLPIQSNSNIPQEKQGRRQRHQELHNGEVERLNIQVSEGAPVKNNFCPSNGSGNDHDSIGCLNRDDEIKRIDPGSSRTTLHTDIGQEISLEEPKDMTVDDETAGASNHKKDIKNADEANNGYAREEAPAISTVTPPHGGNNTRGEWESLSIIQQRANALESLLELCAQLLQQERLDELAGILRPFGEEAVSSRETAIWLTKSLLSGHKYGSESKTN